MTCHQIGSFGQRKTEETHHNNNFKKKFSQFFFLRSAIYVLSEMWSSFLKGSAFTYLNPLFQMIKQSAAFTVTLGAAPCSQNKNAAVHMTKMHKCCYTLPLVLNGKPMYMCVCVHGDVLAGPTGPCWSRRWWCGDWSVVSSPADLLPARSHS